MFLLNTTDNTLERVCSIGIQAVLILKEIHSHGILVVNVKGMFIYMLGVIHLDVNPSNMISVGPEEKVQLIDFGYAMVKGDWHFQAVAGTLRYGSLM